MSEIWAVIVVIVLGLVVYGMVCSKISERRRRKAREKVLPYIADTIQAGTRYDLQMSDGRYFKSVEILGTNDADDGQFPQGGWESMLVLRLDSGKRAFVRHSSVRCVVEV